MDIDTSWKLNAALEPANAAAQLCESEPACEHYAQLSILCLSNYERCCFWD